MFRCNDLRTRSDSRIDPRRTPVPRSAIPHPNCNTYNAITATHRTRVILGYQYEGIAICSIFRIPDLPVHYTSTNGNKCTDPPSHYCTQDPLYIPVSTPTRHSQQSGRHCRINRDSAHRSGSLVESTPPWTLDGDDLGDAFSTVTPAGEIKCGRGGLDTSAGDSAADDAIFDEVVPSSPSKEAAAGRKSAP